ncbi:MAG: hypothetical protein D6739_10900 [Nitrospirae bacterium]|nr:MAG: hypothetical protein D6739_10900 [Nitrospirota bacterium]
MAETTETAQEVTFDVRDDVRGKVIGEGKGVPFYKGTPSPNFPPGWVTYEGKDYLLYRDAPDSDRPYIIVR